ncbi:L-lysine 6-monooxygenase (NADPH-requiring)-domain-containing protein [Boeremia exigua]|uniref:L-lysine 6-monooxygenase (NADPH-requiring)-domain-containing protein n=1 Tax=Boeremia exigua TaxID=749465 RepID=UPI001E8D55F6|nr:L-lysine 6-monooxygenase (NADPH-requiring)-domain-containing protein [Boeremia exigua]KAH6633425.1 L-lysine 6-monooxygenase (NADPH-requiring)-domain-containing protein [Boeremia exigua]
MSTTQQTSRPLDGTSNSSSSPLYDLVCVGFGAAQLATAIANREARTDSKVLFLERKPSFSWHSGTHLSRARMEVPFLYDLASLRNPKSAFSYSCYLLAKDRLVEFANSDRLNPLRDEFEDYLKWCAEQFSDQVRYGSEVVGVAPETENNTVRSWKIAVKDGNGKTYIVRAKNVAAPTPGKHISAKEESLTSVNFLAGQRIMPMADYLSRRNELRQPFEPRLNIAIVGSSQQTIEILDDLLSCPRLGNVTVVTENEDLAPLKVLGEQEPPQPRLCSIWSKPSCDSKAVTDASELVQAIYMRAYEKQVQSKGEYTFRLAIGKDASEPCSKADVIIRDTSAAPFSSSGLLQSLNTLVLGCHQLGESFEEVQFKRGAVADARMWLMSANSEGGRSLAKDISLRAGEVVSALSSPPAGRRDGLVQARI